MTNSLVSIIIPVYKTEQYIKKTVDSVLNQSYPNIEVLLIDDESPDSCGKICDDYAEKYENFRAFHQENGGVGKCRNTGFDNVRGKYMMFLDSDDIIDGENAIELLVEAAEKNNADITQGNYRRLVEDKPQDIRKCALSTNDNPNTLHFRYAGFYSSGHLSYTWAKLYKVEFLQKFNIRTVPIRFTQDKLYNMMCYLHKPKYAFVEQSVYLYRINPKSVTFKYKNNYGAGWVSIAENIDEYMKKQNCEEEYFDFVTFHILFGALFVARQEIIKNGSLKQAKNALKEYSQLPLVEPSFKKLAKGEYLSEVDGKVIKTAYHSFSKMMLKGHYGMLSLGVWFLIKFKYI